MKARRGKKKEKDFARSKSAREGSESLSAVPERLSQKAFVEEEGGSCVR